MKIIQLNVIIKKDMKCEVKRGNRIYMNRIGFYLIVLVILSILFFIIIIVAMIKNTRNHSGMQMVKVATDYLKYCEEQEEKKQAMIDKQNQSISKIAEIDQNFSMEEFKDLVNECMKYYFLVRNYNDDMSIHHLRTITSEAFMKDYIEEVANIKKHHKYIFDAIELKEMIVKDVNILNNKLTIYCDMLVTYTKKEFNEQNILIRLKQYHQCFEGKMIKIEDHENVDVRMNCPNCGAAVDMVLDSKCPYCKSVIYKKINIWLLDNIIKKIDDVR